MGRENEGRKNGEGNSTGISGRKKGQDSSENKHTVQGQNTRESRLPILMLVQNAKKGRHVNQVEAPLTTFSDRLATKPCYYWLACIYLLVGGAGGGVW
jgi:hypothetical protein